MLRDDTRDVPLGVVLQEVVEGVLSTLDYVLLDTNYTMIYHTTPCQTRLDWTTPGLISHVATRPK